MPDINAHHNAGIAAATIILTGLFMFTFFIDGYSFLRSFQAAVAIEVFRFVLILLIGFACFFVENCIKTQYQNQGRRS
jgi:predicted cation transporter